MSNQLTNQLVTAHISIAKAVFAYKWSFKLLFDGLYGVSDCKQCFPSRFTKRHSVLLAEGTLHVSFPISDEMQKQNPLRYRYLFIFLLRESS